MDKLRILIVNKLHCKEGGGQNFGFQLGQLIEKVKKGVMSTTLQDTFLNFLLLVTQVAYLIIKCLLVTIADSDQDNVIFGKSQSFF